MPRGVVGEDPLHGHSVLLKVRRTTPTIRREIMRPALLFQLTIAGGLSACGVSDPDVDNDPNAARFVVEDLDRFWEAYDSAFVAGVGSAQRPAIFQRVYLDRGSTGLDEFVERRIESAQRLAAAVESARAYYEAIRPNTFAAASPSTQQAMREIYSALDQRYADARFPDAYFMIGRLSTGGTVGNAGLLIGVELYSRDANTPVDELSPWGQAVTSGPALLPAIVAHELVHVQQRHGASEGEPLLNFAINEGMADFVGELLSGLNINQHVHDFADPIEAELWEEFMADMNGATLSGWMFQGSNAPAGRPADLGYYFGYKITEAFYDGASDKVSAIRELFDVSDYADFLARSGYMGGS